MQFWEFHGDVSLPPLLIREGKPDQCWARNQQKLTKNTFFFVFFFERLFWIFSRIRVLLVWKFFGKVTMYCGLVCGVLSVRNILIWKFPPWKIMDFRPKLENCPFTGESKFLGNRQSVHKNAFNSSIHKNMKKLKHKRFR